MKKLFLFILFFSIFYSCDKIIDYNIYIDNQYNDSINVEFVNYSDTIITKEIAGNSYKFVKTIEGLEVRNGKIIISMFKEISVSDDNKISNKSFLEDDSWIFKIVSDTEEDCILKIDSTDFNE